MTSKQRAQLKKHAQVLKASFQIGAGELHESNLNALVDAFNKKELVKVKVNRVDKTDKNITREIANEIETKTDIQVVDIIGATMILYKKNKNSDLNILD